MHALPNSVSHRIMNSIKITNTYTYTIYRFGLNIVPLMRPTHGLFYSISIHCRYHCPDIGEDDVNELKALYSSFLSGLVILMKSTKVLLKRLQ